MSAEREPRGDTEVDTRLVGEALEALGDEPCSVLDIGPASPGTMQFFAGFRCRLVVADALGALAELGRIWPVDPEPLADALQEAIPVEPERPWRLVLLWDILDYLPGPLLEAMTRRLLRGLAPGARLHGFVSPAAERVAARPARYEIISAERLSRRPASESESVPAARHTPWHLQRYMPGLTVERSRQRRDGRQEHLLAYGR